MSVWASKGVVNEWLIREIFFKKIRTNAPPGSLFRACSFDIPAFTRSGTLYAFVSIYNGFEDAYVRAKIVVYLNIVTRRYYPSSYIILILYIQRAYLPCVPREYMYIYIDYTHISLHFTQAVTLATTAQTQITRISPDSAHQHHHQQQHAPVVRHHHRRHRRANEALTLEVAPGVAKRKIVKPLSRARVKRSRNSLNRFCCAPLRRLHKPLPMKTLIYTCPYPMNH